MLIGTKVKLREDSDFWGQSKGTIGTITELRASTEWFTVKWGTGLEDGYREKDLDIVREHKKQDLLALNK